MCIVWRNNRLKGKYAMLRVSGCVLFINFHHSIKRPKIIVIPDRVDVNLHTAAR